MNLLVIELLNSILLRLSLSLSLSLSVSQNDGTDDPSLFKACGLKNVFTMFLLYIIYLIILALNPRKG